MNVLDHYSGFEGENELIVEWRVAGSPQWIVRAWQGYFDQLIDNYPAPPDGWSGIALHHHIHTGWNELSEWVDPEPEHTLNVLIDAQKQTTSAPVEAFAKSLIAVVRCAVSEGGELVWRQA